MGQTGPCILLVSGVLPSLCGTDFSTQKGHWHDRERVLKQDSVLWAISEGKFGVTSKDPSSSDDLKAWPPMLRAPFGEKGSLIQVVVRVGQGVSEAWSEDSQEGGVLGVSELWRSVGSGSGLFLEQVTVASQLPAGHTKQLQAPNSAF